MKEEDRNRRREREKKTFQNTVDLEKLVRFRTRGRRVEGSSCPDQYHCNPYLNTPLNTLLIWYQYLLKSIDYMMFYAVRRISTVHSELKQLHVCESDQTPTTKESHKPNRIPSHFRMLFVSTALRQRTATMVNLQQANMSSVFYGYEAPFPPV